MHAGTLSRFLQNGDGFIKAREDLLSIDPSPPLRQLSPLQDKAKSVI
jgi:hypothetical protein